jgi:7-cyano-7-deazaguanine synthase
MPKAVVLLSGGLDSVTTLALAREQGFDCYALSLEYGQRHTAELDAARRLASAAKVKEHKVIRIELDAVGGSALTDVSIAVPDQPSEGIPVTYVPARNTVFLSLALGWAEVLGAWDLFIGVNAVDYSGYPDCRPEFIAAFEQLARLATKGGVEGGAYHVARQRLSARGCGSGSTIRKRCPVIQPMTRVAPAGYAMPAACGPRDSGRRGWRTPRAISPDWQCGGSPVTLSALHFRCQINTPSPLGRGLGRGNIDRRPQPVTIIRYTGGYPVRRS